MKLLFRADSLSLSAVNLCAFVEIIRFCIFEQYYCLILFDWSHFNMYIVHIDIENRNEKVATLKRYKNNRKMRRMNHVRGIFF